MKALGIVCLVICGICVFIAIERYNANARGVRAMNSFRKSSPLGGMMPGGMMPGGDLKPATPAATKYAILFAMISGIGGAVLLVKSGAGGPQEDRQ